MANETVVLSGLIDAMAHLDDGRIENCAHLLKRAVAAGVVGIVSAGVNPLEPFVVIEGVASSLAVWRAFGIHPMALTDEVNFQLQLRALKEVLISQQVVALGEIGLDTRPGVSSRMLQDRALDVQLDLADEFRVPVILHCVGATGRLLDRLMGRGRLVAGGMLHNFGGPAELLDAWIDLGLSFSFGSKVLNERAKRCRAAAVRVPLERLLVESDTPDQKPPGWPSELNEPASIVGVIECLARLRGESVEAVARATATNAQCLYGIGGRRDMALRSKGSDRYDDGC